MIFKFTVLFTCLACVCAGYLESASYQTSPLAYHTPALSYSSPALSYGYQKSASQLTYSDPIAHQTYAAPIAHHAYVAPIARNYTAFPALSYTHSYAPVLSYGHSYAPALAYSAPVATKTAPLLIASTAWAYAPSHATSYTGSFMKYNSPAITYAY